MKSTTGEKTFYVFNYIILTLISFITLYPFLYVFSASISSPEQVTLGNVILFPKGFELSAYKEVFEQRGIWISYLNTFFYTIVGTFVNIVFTILGAYPLSKKRLMGRKVINFGVAFTMWFNAGIIPFYLNMKNLNLIDTRLGIIIAFACTAFYVFLLKTYFQSIPDSIEESAKMDGANDFIIMLKIYLPLSIPSLATIGLYYAVNRWNSYFWAMILIKDDYKLPLQVLIRKLVVQMNVQSDMLSVTDVINYSRETIIYSTIVVSVIPMLCIYPFIQKFFIKGIMVGSIKE